MCHFSSGGSTQGTRVCSWSEGAVLHPFQRGGLCPRGLGLGELGLACVGGRSRRFAPHTILKQEDPLTYSIAEHDLLWASVLLVLLPPVVTLQYHWPCTCSPSGDGEYCIPPLSVPSLSMFWKPVPFLALSIFQAQPNPGLALGVRGRSVTNVVALVLTV